MFFLLNLLQLLELRYLALFVLILVRGNQCYLHLGFVSNPQWEIIIEHLTLLSEQNGIYPEQ